MNMNRIKLLIGFLFLIWVNQQIEGLIVWGVYLFLCGGRYKGLTCIFSTQFGDAFFSLPETLLSRLYFTQLSVFLERSLHHASNDGDAMSNKGKISSQEVRQFFR
jgi:hypothetical protein